MPDVSMPAPAAGQLSVDPRDLKSVFDGITSRLVESSGPSALFDAVVHIAMETTDAQASSLYLEPAETPKPAERRITMMAGDGYERKRIGHASYALGQGLTGSIWQRSETVKYDTADDLKKSGLWSGIHDSLILDQDPAWVCSSLIGVPLRIGKRTIGVIKVENKNPGVPNHFTDRDQVLLELIASTMALAIEDRRLSERAYSGILIALREVSEKLVSRDVPFSVLCDQVVSKCVEIFDAQACSLYLENVASGTRGSEETITMVAGAGYEKKRKALASYIRGQGLTGSIWARSEIVKYDSAAQLKESGLWSGVHDGMILDKDPGWVCSSLIGVPLRIGKRAIGVIKVENKNPGPPAHFSYEELRSLEIVAGNIALALNLVKGQQDLFWRGTQARDCGHEVANQIRTAMANMETCKADLGRLAPHQVEAAHKSLAVIEKCLEKATTLRTNSMNAPVGRSRVTLQAAGLVKEFLEANQSVLDQRQIQLDEMIDPEPAFVNVDKDEIWLALNQLFWNAVEALSGITQPRISVKVRTNTTVGRVEIRIADNGPGLDGRQRRIFQEHRRIPSTKMAGIGGTGIPQAHRFCRDNGGDLLLAETDATQGTEFLIELPLCKPMLLLLAVVDDQETVTDTFRLHLSSREDVHAEYFDSLECFSPDSGVNMDRFDVILLDCHFSGNAVSGPDVYRELLERKPSVAAKIILMSFEPEFLQSGRHVLRKSEDILMKLDAFVDELRARGATR